MKHINVNSFKRAEECGFSEDEIREMWLNSLAYYPHYIAKTYNALFNEILTRALIERWMKGKKDEGL